MKKWLAGLMMVCVIGNAAAQSTVRGKSDDKDHPTCEGQHDCRGGYQDGKSNGSADGTSGKGTKAGNDATAKGKSAGKNGKTGKATGGFTGAAGVATGIGAVAVAAAIGGGGNHGSAPKPSSP